MRWLRGGVVLIVLVEKRGLLVVLVEGSVVVIVVLIAEHVIAGVGVIEHAGALLPHRVVIVVRLPEEPRVGVVVVVLAEDVIGGIIGSGVVCMWR